MIIRNLIFPAVPPLLGQYWNLNPRMGIYKSVPEYVAELGPEYIQYKDLITNDGITLEFLKWIVENGQFEMFSDEYSDQYIVNLQHKSVFRDHIIDILSPRVSGERFGESVQMRLEHEFELFRVNGPTLVCYPFFLQFFPFPPLSSFCRW